MKKHMIRLLAIVSCFVAGSFVNTVEPMQVYAAETTTRIEVENREEMFAESIESGLDTEEIRYEGQSGNISWCITMDGTLYLEGDGDYSYNGENTIHHCIVPEWADDLYSYSISNAVVNIKNCTSLCRLFFFCDNLETVNLNGLDFSKVTNMQQMFSGCSSLKSLDTSKFDTSKVTNMLATFSGCSSLKKLDVTGFDTSNVKDMYELFYNCSNVTKLDVTGFDTSSVEDMSGMFRGCSSLTALDVTGFDTSKVGNMGYMFADCSGIKKLDVTNFDTSSARQMNYMFRNCSSLTALDVTNFNTSQVFNFSMMFSLCSGLTKLDVTHFDTSNTIDMSGMFYGCSGLKAIDVTGFDTKKVRYLGFLFDSCSKLEKIDVSIFNTSKVNEFTCVFRNCSELEEIDIYSWNMASATDTMYMFSGCDKLKKVMLPENIKLMGYRIFLESTNLESVFIPSSVTTIENEWIENGTTIACYSGSKAESWAKENSHSYEIVNHTHTYKTVASKDANCKQAGYVKYKCSYSGCGAAYSKTLQATEHTKVIDKAVEATCTESGLTEGSHCSVCNTVIVAQKTVKAKGHTKVVDKAVEATCTKSGLTEGSHCSVCNTVMEAQKTVKAKGHTVVVDEAVEATCTKSGLTEGSHCSVCSEVLVKQETIDKKAHSYEEIVTQAEIGKEGSIVKTCTGCEKSSSIIIPAIKTVTLSKTTYTYNGKTQKPTVTVMDTAGAELAEDTDYTVSYSKGCKKVGSYTVTVNFLGNYTGSKNLTYTINPKKYKSCSLSNTTYTYDGKEKKPSVTIKASNGKNLKKGTDYTVSYSKGCKNPGIYTVTVKFKGDYTGNKSRTLTYTIKPKSVEISKVTAKSKGFKVKVKKGTAISGYEIQYSTSKKFTKKTTEKVTIKATNTTSKTISKLKAKKKYYVRVRTYKTVTVNGKSTKIYSSWSKVKNVTTKK